MSKLAIVATAEIAPGRMNDALALLLAHADRCVAEEPGTEQFQILKVRDAENTVMLFEVYRDDAAFKAHWNGPLVARFKAETAGVVGKLNGTWCDLYDASARQAPDGIPLEDLNASNDE